MNSTSSPLICGKRAEESEDIIDTNFNDKLLKGTAQGGSFLFYWAVCAGGLNSILDFKLHDINSGKYGNFHNRNERLMMILKRHQDQF